MIRLFLLLTALLLMIHAVAFPQSLTLRTTGARMWAWDPPHVGYRLVCPPLPPVDLPEDARTYTLPPEVPATCCTIAARYEGQEGVPSAPVCVTPPVPPAVNLLAGGDFEGATIPGTTGGYAGTRPQVTLTTADVHSGTRALQISGTGYQYGYWISNRISVPGASTLQVTVLLRLVQAKALTVWALLEDAQGRQVRVQILASAAGTQDWGQLEGFVGLAPPITGLRVQIRCEGTNMVCVFDDVTVTRSN